LLGRDTLGVERDGQRVAVAAARMAPTVHTSACRPAFAPRFVRGDVCREGLSLTRNDLAVGLHACGELGDTLVTTVANAGCQLALVSCCLQKITAPHRQPLSQAAISLTLPRGVLGLTNLIARPNGVETDIATTLRARQTRYALRLLLRDRGTLVAPGAEMHGINRRKAHRGWPALAEYACAARAMPPPTPAELLHHEAQAARDFAVMRRLSLPRNMLARLIEVAVVLDRAAVLYESGLHVQVATLCSDTLTPRNLALFAGPNAQHIPAGPVDNQWA